MTSFAPLFLALLLNCCGVYIFTRPKNYDSLPYLSYVIFLISVYFLLFDACLIPGRFRKLFRWAHLIIEFSIVMLLMEFIVNNLWFPLEMGVLSVIPKLPHMITTLLRLMGIKYSLCDSLDFLKNPKALWVASYILSMFLFMCIGHATRFLNLKLLTECGLYYFAMDIADRAREFATAMQKSMFKKPRRKRKNRRVTFSRKPECDKTDFDSEDFSSDYSINDNM